MFLLPRLLVFLTLSLPSRGLRFGAFLGYVRAVASERRLIILSECVCYFVLVSTGLEIHSSGVSLSGADES